MAFDQMVYKASDSKMFTKQTSQSHRLFQNCKHSLAYSDREHIQACGNAVSAYFDNRFI